MLSERTLRHVDRCWKGRSGSTMFAQDGYVTMQLGGTPTAESWRVTFEQLKDQLVGCRVISEREADAYCALLDSPDYRWLLPVGISVSGQAPSQ